MKTLKYILIVVAPFVICCLLCAFIKMEFNFMKWGEDERAFISFLSSSLCAILIAYLIIEKQKI